MTPAPKRWFRWSLRTMFVVVTVVAVVIGWLGSSMHWIRQRHALQAYHTARPRPPRGLEREFGPEPKPFSIIPPAAKSIGYGLRILGEQNVSELKLFLAKSSSSDGPGQDEVELAARLFPEANILVFRDLRPYRRAPRQETRATHVRR